MTDKEIPGKKYFNSLLDNCSGNEDGFQPLANSGWPLFRELEAADLRGHEFLSEKIYYCYCVKSEQVDESIYVKCDTAYVQLIQGLRGSVTIWREEEPLLKVSPNTAQVVSYPKGEIRVTADSKETVEVVVINIHKSLIDPKKPYLTALNSFIQNQRADTFSRFSPFPIPIGYQMRQIIEELSGKKYSGCFLSHFIEIKILELLLHYLDECTEKTPARLDSNQRVVQQMEEVRRILLQNLSHTPTLKTLAAAVGTNEFHLKTHFKSHFGKTVMGFLRDYKMNWAKKQLTDTECRINDIAERLGYKHATHFSAAFKKYHGKLPKEFR